MYLWNKSLLTYKLKLIKEIKLYSKTKISEEEEESSENNNNYKNTKNSKQIKSKGENMHFRKKKK